LILNVVQPQRLLQQVLRSAVSKRVRPRRDQSAITWRHLEDTCLFRRRRDDPVRLESRQGFPPTRLRSEEVPVGRNVEVAGQRLELGAEVGARPDHLDQVAPPAMLQVDQLQAPVRRVDVRGLQVQDLADPSPALPDRLQEYTNPRR
jgi:hypothetical protein